MSLHMTSRRWPKRSASCPKPPVSLTRRPSGAIVSTLAIPEQMIVHSPYDRNGHAADYDRYKAPVLEMVRNWLAEHGNPRPIAAKGKNYRVKYAS